jgi:hypothetical protein
VRKQLNQKKFHPSYGKKHKNWMIMFQISPGRNQEPISKITRAKSVGSMAQVVEGLSSNQDLSTPVLPKTKIE